MCKTRRMTNEQELFQGVVENVDKLICLNEDAREKCQQMIEIIKDKKTLLFKVVLALRRFRKASEAQNKSEMGAAYREYMRCRNKANTIKVH